MIDKIKTELNSLTEAIQNNDKFNSLHLLNLICHYIDNKKHSELDIDLLKDFLCLSKHPVYLENLPDREKRYEWAGIAFKLIKYTDFSLLDLINYSIKVNPDKPVFRTIEPVKNNFTYSFLKRRINIIASVIHNKYGENPKAAIFANNSLDVALLDIACLSHDIFVAPFNVHFSEETLSYIFLKFKFNVIFTDSIQKVELLQKIKEKFNYQYDIVLISDKSSESHNYLTSDNYFKLPQNFSVEDVLNKRKKNSLDDISTIMFTSGSTGLPKIVGFTNYNLLSKRFARGAALPFAGNDTFISYLPLYHTFGRYLEMLGTLYWNGTYVFARKNDINSLMEYMRQVQPSALISIPLRWQELHENFLETYRENKKEGKQKAFEKVTGGKLKWGLSAAGYLEPKVFNFFNSMNVFLCSGFGMTEATGGISMTPPGEYVSDSVGIPLPGIQTSLNENGELVISGEYVGEYLNEDRKGSKQKDKFINTGDLFVQDSNGHLFIIDRIKDIYKNIKGQTIAPAFIEKKFDRIPGFKRVFLAGDMKPFNSLLIVPDNEDPFIEKFKSEEDLKTYYSSIVSNINKGLQPYERILKFLILLNRDFDVNKGELTAKGTFNRKIIRENFAKEINELYRKNDLEFSGNNLKIHLPIWMLKDIGISEEEVVFHNNRLFVKGSEKSLTIKLKKKNYNTVNFESSKNYNHIQIGSFDYLIEDKVVDLGLFVRNPFFWVANIELINFFKCKEDWETPFTKISTQLFLAEKSHPENYNYNVNYLSSHIKDINFNCVKIIFGMKEEVLVSLTKLQKVLSTGENNIANMVSRRIEILAYNNDFEIRSTAYKIMLLNQPKIDYNKYLPSFINSGKTFLNKNVIEEILYSNFEGFNLEALRQRLESYRTGLNWPLPKKYVNHFKRIFELLAYFAHKNPASYTQIRAELIAWILHRKDPKISAAAQNVFTNLYEWWESRIKLSPYEKDENNWDNKLVFQSIISRKEISRLKNILICTSFLREAFQLLIQGETFDLHSVQEKGIFISRLSSAHKSLLYRVSVNTKKQKHFDFIIFIKPDLSTKKVKDTIYLMIKIADKASGQSILPKLGNFRSDLGILSIAFINDLNVQERIRQITSTVSTLKYDENVKTLELLFKRGMSGYFKFLKDSEYSIIPGNISPYNVVVAEPFYKEGITILSITGWEDFKDYTQLFIPLYQNFYYETLAHYPIHRDVLKISWMFDACLEGLGVRKGLSVLRELQSTITERKLSEYNFLLNELNNYFEKDKKEYYKNTFLDKAVFDYYKWLIENPNAKKSAKADFAINLHNLYRIYKYEDLVRFLFYLETYFQDKPDNIKNMFSHLINSSIDNPKENINNKVEIVEIQDSFEDKSDNIVFKKMLFPYLSRDRFIDVVADVQQPGLGTLVVRTTVEDDDGETYYIRNPLSPFEIGTLHKLFINDNYPIKIDDELQYLVIIDKDEQFIVGGIIYKVRYPRIAHLEGIEVAKEFRQKNIGRKLIMDFFDRLSAIGMRTLTTHYFLKSFFEKFGFKSDEHWGGLVKFLNRDERIK